MRYVASAFLSTLLATVALAQTSTAVTQSDTQAQTLIQKASAAQMGANVVQDVQLTGTVATHFGKDDNGTITLQGDAAGHSKVVFSLGNGTRTEYSSARSEDPACTWSDTKTDSTGTHEVARHNCATDGVWFFPVISFSQSAHSGQTSLSYNGVEQKDNASLQHLTAAPVLPPARPMEKEVPRAFLRKLGTQNLYLDSQTSLPALLSFATHPDNDAGTDIPIEVRFSDYRSVSGVMVPFHIEKTMNGNTVLDITIQSATFNTGAVSK